mmetsp:Transcript_25873/g.66757  ORF Transcript_25873/g.66757 Transcript_25873/m.66757 type:complete len:175 (-) Transcript_25873:420-944(-)
MFTLVSSVASALHLLRGTPNDLNLVDNYIHDAGPLEVEQSHAVYVNASKAIVVSQYEEDIGWLQELQSKVNDSMLTVSIYQSKDDSKPGFVKNVGNEAYKYLRYIVDNYDDLPETSSKTGIGQAPARLRTQGCRVKDEGSSFCRLRSASLRLWKGLPLNRTPIATVVCTTSRVN